MRDFCRRSAGVVCHLGIVGPLEKVHLCTCRGLILLIRRVRHLLPSANGGIRAQQPDAAVSVQLYGIMASIFAFLGLSLVLFFVILLVTSERVRLHRNGATNAEVEQSRSRGVIFLTRGESKLIGLMNMPINVTFASLPFAIVYLIVVGTGLLGKTEYMVKQFWSSQIIFFIPSSGTDLSEPDQAVALAFGAVTLLFSLYDAYESRLKEVKTRCEETELTENSGIRRSEE